jgi:hypothetical protein
VTKYNQSVDNESAYEILGAKLEQASQKTKEEKEAKQEQKASGRTKKEESIFDNPMVRQVERTAATVLTRSLLGVLGLGGRRKRLF